MTEKIALTQQDVPSVSADRFSNMLWSRTPQGLPLLSLGATGTCGWAAGIHVPPEHSLGRDAPAGQGERGCQSQVCWQRSCSVCVVAMDLEHMLTQPN